MGMLCVGGSCSEFHTIQSELIFVQLEWIIQFNSMDVSKLRREEY
jgi:deoxyhypusine synthase